MSDVLQFQCNSCGAPLTVPRHMAGVSGPCPKCGATITSPQASDIPAMPALPTMPAMTPPVHAAPPAAAQQPPAPPMMSSSPAMMRPPAMESAPTSLPPWLPSATSSANPDAPADQQSAPQSNGFTNLPPRRPPGQPPAAATNLLSQAPGFPSGDANPSQAWSAPPMSLPPVMTQQPAAPAASSGGGLFGPPASGSPAQPGHDPAFPGLPPQQSSFGNESARDTILPSPGGGAKNFPRTDMAPDLQLRGRKKSGKLAGTVGLMLLLGALGAGGWYLREPIQQIAKKYFPSKDTDDSAPMPQMTDATSASPAAPAEVSSSNGAVFDPTQQAQSTNTPAVTIEKAAPVPSQPPVQNLQPIVAPSSSTPAPDSASAPAASSSGTDPVAPLAATPTDESPLITPPDVPAAVPSSPPDLATTIRPAEAPTEMKPIIEEPVDTDTLPKPKSMRPEIVEDPPGSVPAAVPVSSSGAIKSTTEMAAKTGSVIEVPAPGTARSSEPSASHLPSSGGPTITTTPEAAPAVDGLRSFFAAKDYMQRSQHVLGAKDTLPLMERYYSKMPDGPMNVDDIKLLRYDPKPDIGTSAHAVFTVSSKLWPYPIPIMLQEEKEGFKVDWISFIEFKDDLLFKFLSEFRDEPARFHVGIRRTHYFESDVPDREGKDCFEVQPPLPTYVGFVFVPSNAPLAKELEGKISWETRTAFVIVELQWRRQGDYKWVELTAVPQLNWYSLPLEPKPAAPAKLISPPAGEATPSKSSSSTSGTTIKSGEGTISKR